MRRAFAKTGIWKRMRHTTLQAAQAQSVTARATQRRATVRSDERTAAHGPEARGDHEPREPDDRAQASAWPYKPPRPMDPALQGQGQRIWQGCRTDTRRATGRQGLCHPSGRGLPANRPAPDRPPYRDFASGLADRQAGAQKSRRQAPAHTAPTLPFSRTGRATLPCRKVYTASTTGAIGQTLRQARRGPFVTGPIQRQTTARHCSATATSTAVTATSGR